MTTTQIYSSAPEELNGHIGIVTHVDPAIVQVQLTHGTASYDESGKEVRAYVLIDCGAQALFGQIAKISFHSTNTWSKESDEQRELLAEVRLLATIQSDSGEILRGASVSPQLGDDVYSAPPSLIKAVVEGRSSIHQETAAVVLNFATLPSGTPLEFTPEKLFGRHCAVLGSSGGGKSFSIARLVEETAQLGRAKVILFDAVGEYFRLSDGVRHAYMGDEADVAPSAEEVVLPFYQLLEKDLFAIFKPSLEVQVPKLRAAIKSLKLAWLEPSLAPDGTIVKAHKAKKQIEDALLNHASELDSPFAEFDIGKLTRQIELECVNAQRSAQEPHVWGEVNQAERSACVPLISRVQELIRSSSLAPIFSPHGKRSLFQEISSFVKDDSAAVLRLSLRHLSFAHHAREIIANAAGRFLLEAARRGYFKERPLLVVVDEAHQFLNSSLQSEDEIYPLDSFALIAKEGRKYALNICIATQRPRDIPEGVLSQMGTFVVHRLTNDHDRNVVERASGSLDRTSLESLPALVPGQAVIMGVDFPIPLTVQVCGPSQEPDSRGPNYQRFWG